VQEYCPDLTGSRLIEVRAGMALKESGLNVEK